MEEYKKLTTTEMYNNQIVLKYKLFKASCIIDEYEYEIEEQGMEEQEMHSTRYVTKVGRNDPCVCGSGKKYKKCCLAKHEAEIVPLSPMDGKD